jgi:predicted LPLAT superfamily acyltransferase
MTFARMVLDRVYWLSAKEHGIPVRVHGLDAIEAALAGRRSGIPRARIPSGQLPALRGAGNQVCGRRIRPLMYVANAQMQQVLMRSIRN